MYDPLRKLQTPDFYPDQQPQGWVDMGDDQQIDVRPVAGAFKQRFMGNRGDMSSSTPMMNDSQEIMDGPDMGGGQPIKKGGMKSL